MTKISPPHRYSPPLSKVENALGCEMDFLFPEQSVRLGARIPIPNSRTLQVDVLLQRSRIVLEYDGWDWHRNARALERDRAKTSLLEANGYKVLRVREDLEPLTPLDVVVSKWFYAATTRWKTQMVDEVIRRISPFLNATELQRSLDYLGVGGLQNLEHAKRRIAHLRQNPNLYRMKEPISKILEMPENPGWRWGAGNSNSADTVGARSHLENIFLCPNGHEVCTIPLHVTVSITKKRAQRICKECISLGQVKPKAIPFLLDPGDAAVPGNSRRHKIILLCSRCGVKLLPRATAEIKNRPPLCTGCQGRDRLAKAQAIVDGEAGPLPEFSLADLARQHSYDLAGKFGIILDTAKRAGPGSSVVLTATCKDCGLTTPVKAISIRQSILGSCEPKFCSCTKSTLAIHKPMVLPFLVQPSDANAPAFSPRKVEYYCSKCGAKRKRDTFRFRNEPPICKSCATAHSNRHRGT